MLIEIAGLYFTFAEGAVLSHDPWLVALSYAIAVFGSYAALDMTDRLRHANARGAVLWHLSASLALGGGIWAMHFVGMLAVSTVVPIAYELFTTVLSFATAVLFVGLGLQVVRLGAASWGRLLSAGALVGTGVAAMHYIGMMAMVFPGRIAYRPDLWSLSILIAVAAGTVALWLSLRLRTAWQRGVAALAMAVAICGMHYTGMGATIMQVDPTAPAGNGPSRGPLAIAVSASTIGLFVLALISASADRRIASAADREAAALRAANLELQAMHAQLEASQREIIRRLCSAGEFRDDDTAQHVARIADLSHRLALAAGCDPAFAERLREAAPLHDIGKVGIPDRILLKPGKLDAAEWEIMKRHAEMGAKILGGSGLPLLDLAAEVALTHHERWDGSGYPRGLRGEQIPLEGRIVAVVDVFDALLSPRPYKEAWPLNQVVELIRDNKGKQFDPFLTDIFLQQLPKLMECRGATA